MKRHVAAACLAALLLVPISACSTPAPAPDPDREGSESEQTESPSPTPKPQLYSFANEDDFVAEGSVVVEIPDALTDEMGDDARRLPVRSYTITPHPLETSKFCAVDLAVYYINDGLERITLRGPQAAQTEQAIATEDMQRRIDDVRERAERKTGLQGEEALRAQYKSDPSGKYYADLGLRGDTLANRNPVTTYQAANEVALNFVKEQAAERVANAQQVPVPTLVGGALVRQRRDFPASALTPEPDEAGVYVADDGKTLTVVQPCAADTSGASTTDATVKFPQSPDEENPLADFQVVVMKSGTIVIRNGQVKTYILDKDGNWVAR